MVAYVVTTESGTGGQITKWESAGNPAKKSQEALRRGFEDGTATPRCRLLRRGAAQKGTCNASAWRGETAKRVKAELKKLAA